MREVFSGANSTCIAIKTSEHFLDYDENSIRNTLQFLLLRNGLESVCFTRRHEVGRSTIELRYLDSQSSGAQIVPKGCVVQIRCAITTLLGIYSIMAILAG